MDIIAAEKLLIGVLIDAKKIPSCYQILKTSSRVLIDAKSKFKLLLLSSKCNFSCNTFYNNLKFMKGYNNTCLPIELKKPYNSKDVYDWFYNISIQHSECQALAPCPDLDLTGLIIFLFCDEIINPEVCSLK